MTTRRDALLALPLLYPASLTHAQAPKAGPPKRLGALFPGPDNQGPREQRPFYIALRKRGWILGENLLAEPAYADRNYERLEALAEELVRKRVDLILCDADQAAVRAARATRTIPIVFINVLFPVELGLIDSYAKPGRNVTGQTLFAGLEVTQKRTSFLKEIVPSATRLSQIVSVEGPEYFPTLAGGRFDPIPTIARMNKDVGFETRFHTLRSPQDVDSVFGEIIDWRAQAVSAGVGWNILDARQHLTALAIRYRLPSAFIYRELVDAGGLLSFGVGPSEQVYAQERLVEYVDLILRGTRPADLPVERPKRYELAINMNSANALGLTIPQSLLLRADEVIK